MKTEGKYIKTNKVISIQKNKYTLENVVVRLVNTKDPLISETPFNCPANVVHAMANKMSEFDREIVAIINLKTDMTPINVHFASVGSLNAAIAEPRELLKAAILSNSANMILIHNHPSNRLEPSDADKFLSKRMEKVCELVGIPLVDHIIVGTDSSKFYSFREHGIFLQGNDVKERYV